MILPPQMEQEKATRGSSAAAQTLKQARQSKLSPATSPRELVSGLPHLCMAF